MIIIVFYCSIMNYHKPSSLKQHICIILNFLWVRSPGMGKLSLLMDVCSGYHWAEIKVLAGAGVSSGGWRPLPHSFRLLPGFTFMQLSCRTEALVSFRLLDWGCSKHLESVFRGRFIAPYGSPFTSPISQVHLHNPFRLSKVNSLISNLISGISSCW